jgi:hypothetical protein
LKIKLTLDQREKINTAVADVRNGKLTRFSGGSSLYDFHLDRDDAVDRIIKLMEELAS